MLSQRNPDKRKKFETGRNGNSIRKRLPIVLTAISSPTETHIVFYDSTSYWGPLSCIQCPENFPYLNNEDPERREMLASEIYGLLKEKGLLNSLVLTLLHKANPRFVNAHLGVTDELMKLFESEGRRLRLAFSTAGDDEAIHTIMEETIAARRKSTDEHSPLVERYDRIPVYTVEDLRETFGI